MKKSWAILFAVTFVATLIIIVPFLPERAHTGATPSESMLSQQSTEVSLLFVGDIMLDRNVAVHAQKVGDEALFAGVTNLISGHDAVIGNLEGTITKNPSIAQKDHSILWFTFDPHFANVLANVGFTAMSLANNHSLDFGGKGYDDTITFLDTVGIAAFGSPYNNKHLAETFSIKDKNICLVGYHALFDPDTTLVLSKIKNIRAACDRIIVMTHWGVEYQHTPTQGQKDSAHAFIDAGADVVIGGHPHVVEPLEIYKNKDFCRLSHKKIMGKTK